MQERPVGFGTVLFVAVSFGVIVWALMAANQPAELPEGLKPAKIDTRALAEDVKKAVESTGSYTLEGFESGPSLEGAVVRVKELVSGKYHFATVHFDFSLPGSPPPRLHIYGCDARRPEKTYVDGQLIEP